MTGYVRKDTTNNIADGNVINAADLDAEFDGVQAAFNASTGHKHDGTASEGATINALGPTQDVTISATLVAPKTTNFVDIGSSGLKFKDMFLAGNASIGGTLAVTGVATFTAQPILSSLTASRAVFSDGSKGLVSNAITGTGNVVMSASPTLTGTIGGASLTLSSLTSGRVTYAGTSGLLQDSANLTFDGTNLGIGGTQSYSGYRTLLVQGTNASNGGVVQIQNSDSSVQAYWLNTSALVSFGSLTSTPLGFLIGNSEQMRLTSTGLGIGTSSPTLKLDVAGSAKFAGSYVSFNDNGYIRTDAANILRFQPGSGGYQFRNAGNSDNLAVLDASGNLGLGVTPNAWFSNRKAFDIGGSVSTVTGANITIFGNNYYTDTGGTNRYVTTGAAAQQMLFPQAGGVQWYNAPSGTAGNAITLTQAMTLDASGRLLIGTTTSGSATGIMQTISNASAAYTQYNKGTSGGGLIGSEGTGVVFYTYTGSLGSETYTQRAIIDSSGNLGLGVTPSAWRTAYETRAIQVGPVGSIFSLSASETNNYTGFKYNNYQRNDGVNIYLKSNFATEYRQANGAHEWYTAPSGTAGNAITFTQAMTLDASGNLGIGTTSPATRLDVMGGSLATSGDGILAAGGLTAGRLVSDGVNLTINPIHTYFDSKAYEISAGSTSGFVSGVVVAARSFTGTGGEGVSFWTRNIERARIDGSGNLLWGITAQTNTPANGIVTQNPTGASQQLIGHANGSGSGTYYNAFLYNSSVIGSITQSGTTAVLFNVTSDQRLKENIVDAPDFGSVIDSIKVRSYDWKTDGLHQRAGFVAQELVAVAPEAVHQPADPDEMMAVDYSKLVPMLVKEIQSLRIRIAQLENKL